MTDPERSGELSVMTGPQRSGGLGIMGAVLRSGRCRSAAEVAS